jgi:hypothetical protein
LPAGHHRSDLISSDRNFRRGWRNGRNI